MRTIFETAGADHLLHYLPADDATCLARVRQRNAAQREGVFFGAVSDALVIEANSHYTQPQAAEGFHVVVHE